MTPEKLALDIRHWRQKPPEVIAFDLAAAVQEMKVGRFAERISFAPLEIIEGRIYDQDLGFVEDCLSTDRPYDSFENEAFYRLQEWAATHESGQAIWISPPYPDEDECRFCVYELKIKEGKKTLFLRGICAGFNERDCLSIGREISRQTPKDQPVPLLANTDQLRANPLVFEPKPGQSWLDFLAEKIDLPEVWQAIRECRDIQARQKILKETEVVARQFESQIAQVETRQQAVWVGALIEQAVQNRMGMVFQAVGSCGFSNQFALSQSRGGIFNVMHGLGRKESGGTFAEKCPYCNAKIGKVIYPGYKCSCGKVFQGVCGGSGIAA